MPRLLNPPLPPPRTAALLPPHYQFEVTQCCNALLNVHRYLRGASLQGSTDANDAQPSAKDTTTAARAASTDDATIVRGSLTYRRVSPNRRPGSLEQLAQFTVGE